MSHGLSVLSDRIWSKKGESRNARRAISRHVPQGHNSIAYSRLPDWFLGFDIFDRQEKRFLDVKNRDAAFASMGIVPVPFLANGIFSLSELLDLFTVSQFGDAPAEGLYLRYDNNGWLQDRCKIVRPSFVQSVQEHWSRSPLISNSLGTSMITVHPSLRL